MKDSCPELGRAINNMSSGFDPIISLVIQIKNAHLAGSSSLDTDYSKYRESVLTVLSKMGFLNFKVYKEEGSFKKLHLDLSSEPEAKRRLVGVRLISRPGRRIYGDGAKLKLLLNKRKNGVVLSTSQGVMNIKDAVKKSLGGELLFEI